MRPCGARTVLIGDPQRRDQPAQGSHREGAVVSALHHILGGERTLPERQVIKGSGPINGPGLYFLPVVQPKSEGSPEEGQAAAMVSGHSPRAPRRGSTARDKRSRSRSTILSSSRHITRRSLKLSNGCRAQEAPIAIPRHRVMRMRAGWSSLTASTGSTLRHPRQVRVDHRWLAKASIRSDESGVGHCHAPRREAGWPPPFVTRK